MKPGDVLKSEDGDEYRLVEAVSGAGKSLPWKAVGPGGQTYFLKRLTSFVFDPDKGDPSSAKYQAKKKAAQKFEGRHREIMKSLEPEIPGGGNLVKPVCMFRDGGAFIKVYPYVDADSCAVIASEPLDVQQLFVKTLLLCVRELHHRGIVHSDLKPDNVLVFEYKAGKKVARLVDFDEAYVAGSPPTPSSRMGGDELYYSPEQLAYKRDEITSREMSTESDIFSLGIVIFKTITGGFPSIRNGDGDGPAERLTTGGSINIHDIPGFPPAFSTALRRCLAVSPADRPSVEELAAAMGVVLDATPDGRVKPDASGARGGATTSRVKTNMGRRKAPTADAGRSPLAPTADGGGLPSPPVAPRSRVQSNVGRGRRRK